MIDKFLMFSTAFIIVLTTITITLFIFWAIILLVKTIKETIEDMKEGL